MAKALKTIGKIASVAAVVLAFIPGAQPFAAAASAIAGVANAGATLLAQPEPIGGDSAKVLIDKSAPSPYVIGRTLTGGVLVHDAGYGSEYKNIPNPNRSMAFVYSDCGPVDAIEALYADGANVGSGGVIGGYYDERMHFDKLSGSRPEPRALSGNQGAIPDWGSSYRLSGKASGLVTMRWDKNQELFAAGTPDFGALVRGVRVYSARHDDTYPGGSGPCRLGDETTYIYSENPSDHALTYLYGRYELGERIFGVGKSIEGIDVPAFVEWANVCEANNWKVGGVIYEPADKWNNLKVIMQAGSARPVHNNGQLSVVFDAPRIPLATFTEDDLANGDVTVPSTRTFRNRLNSIVPIFRSSAHSWEFISGTAVTVDEYVTEDGEIKRAERKYSLCQAEQHGAQLAAYEVVNSRELEGITLPLKPKVLPYGSGDAIDLNMPNLGLVGTFVIQTRSFNPLTAITTVTVRTETSSKHAFALGATTTPPTAPTLLFGEDLDRISFNANGSAALNETQVQTSWTNDIQIDGISTERRAVITISGHSRVYPDETVAVESGQLVGLAQDSDYTIYYDDLSREGGSVGYTAVLTSDYTNDPNGGKGRHFVGYIKTPKDAAAPPTVGIPSIPPNVVPETVPNAAALGGAAADDIIKTISENTLGVTDLRSVYGTTVSASQSAAEALSSQNAASIAATDAETARALAFASENAAAQSAASSHSDSVSAETARSAAESAATSAATSATSSHLSESAAAQSATLAADSELSAGISSTAASTSAATATSKATEAEQSSASAASFAVTAGAARDQASTSANAAAGSASSAAASETAAGQSANAAEGDSLEASTAAANASASEGAAVVSATNAANSESAAATSASLAASSENAANNSATASADSASSAFASQQAAGSFAAASSSAATNAATSESNASTSESNASASETGANNAAAAATLSEVNASSSAAASSAAATSASSSASSSAASSASAATSATEATNAAAAASGSAISASSASTAASDSALAAEVALSVSASLSVGDSWLTNPAFTRWNTGAILPVGFGTYNSSNGTYSRETELTKFSNASRHTVPGSGRFGMLALSWTSSTGGAGTEGDFGFTPNTQAERYFVLEAWVYLESGTWNGAGLFLNYRTVSSHFASRLHSFHDLDLPLGKWVKVQKFIDFGYNPPDDIERFILYGMSNYEFSGAALSPKVILWGSLSVRNATDMEIEANRVVGVEASAAINQSAIASINGDLAASIGLGVKAGTNGAEFELVALDGSGSSGSSARLSAGAIILDGTLTAAHFADGSIFNIAESDVAYDVHLNGSAEQTLLSKQFSSGGGKVRFDINVGGSIDNTGGPQVSNMHSQTRQLVCKVYRNNVFRGSYFAGTFSTIYDDVAGVYVKNGQETISFIAVDNPDPGTYTYELRFIEVPIIENVISGNNVGDPRINVLSVYAYITEFND